MLFWHSLYTSHYVFGAIKAIYSIKSNAITRHGKGRPPLSSKILAKTPCWQNRDPLIWRAKDIGNFLRGALGIFEPINESLAETPT